MSTLLRLHLDHLRRKNARPATIQARRNILAALERATGRDLADLTTEDLYRWQDSLTITTTSIRSYVANVRAFYTWALAEEHIAKNPAARLVPPKVNPTLPRPVPEDALRLAMRTARGQLAPMLVLAAFVGLRVSEIAAIRREDILREPAGVFLLVHGKGGRERVVKLVGDVLADLSPWLCVGGRGAPFTSASGRPITGRQVSVLISTHMQCLGLPYTAHQLRHRFGTRLYGVTRDLRLVQQVMGHASPTMTAGYVQLVPESAAAGMELVAGDLPEVRRQDPPESAASAA